MTRKKALRFRTSLGTVLTLRPQDYIDKIVLEEGYYEPEVFHALEPYLGEHAVFWDIGANFGLHSVSVAHRFPATDVHSFEPSPAIFARLEENVRQNSVAIHCWPFALGEVDGTATLHINSSGNPGTTTLMPWGEAKYDASAIVQVRRADTLVASGEIPAPTAIKLDVEGSEAAVLAGLGALLLRRELRAVVFEADAGLLTDPGRNATARSLAQAGFVFTALSRCASSSHSLGNFLACRPA